MAKEKDKFSEELGNVLQKSSEIKIPQQVIKPIITKEKTKLFALNIPVSLFKELKLVAIEKEVSVKKLLLDAAREAYLK